MEQYQLKSLLDQVTALNTHYKKINSLTGENFNIFRILNLESSEVRLHSAFLAALLNPKGSHGQRDTFLKLFIKQFCFKQNAINPATCKVEVEKQTGFISQDHTEGGRIDIIVSDKSGNHIIIENKIYAGDQRNQLKRYYNHSPKADLIYLTLDGKEPNENSYGNLISNTHFKCYSYKSDILHWLEECRKEVAVYPIVRESITQYINLIKHLTNQTLNHNMQQELSQLLKANLEASFMIADNLDNALADALKDFIPELTSMCNGLDLTCKSSIDFNKNYTGIWIGKNEWQYVNIGFQFQSYDKDLIYGFSTKQNPDKLPIPATLRKQLNTMPNNTHKINGWWPWFRKLEEPYNNWSKYKAWKAITDGTMTDLIKEKVEYLYNAVQGIQL